MPVRIRQEVQALSRALHLTGWRAAAGCALAAIGLLSGAVTAETVTLTSRSDGFALSGALQSFDGAFYRIDAPYGSVTLAASQVTCSGDGCPAPGATTGFAITTAHGPGRVMLPALLQAYGRARGLPVARVDEDATHIRFDFGGAGALRQFPVRVRLALSGEGFADLAVDQANVVLSDRLITVDEAAIARDAGLGDLTSPDTEIVFAWDALVAVTSPRRARQAATPQQILDLWARPAPNWEDMGHAAAPLRLHARAHGQDLSKLAPGGPAPVAPVTYHERGLDLAAVVREQPSGLGLVPLSQRGPAQALALAGPCGLSHAPTRSDVMLGRYPWTMPLALYLPERRLPKDLADFLSFLDSAAARAVLARAGFAQPMAAPVSDALPDRVFAALATATPDQTNALQALALALRDAEQMGLSYLPAATRRDLRALSAASLAQFASVPDDGHRYVLIAQAETPAQAQADADQFLLELAEARNGAAALSTQVVALGNALPVACPEAPWAAEVNRRIDVWRGPLTDTLRIEN